MIVANRVYIDLCIRGDHDTLKEVINKLELRYLDDDLVMPICLNNIFPIPKHFETEKEEREWCEEHWGVNEIYDVEHLDRSGHETNYRFTSTWNAPYLIFAALSKEFPSVEVELQCEFDVDGRNERVTFKNGERITYELLEWTNDEQLVKLQNEEIKNVNGGI